MCVCVCRKEQVCVCVCGERERERPVESGRELYSAAFHRNGPKLASVTKLQIMPTLSNIATSPSDSTSYPKLRPKPHPLTSKAPGQAVM